MRIIFYIIGVVTLLLGSWALWEALDREYRWIGCFSGFALIFGSVLHFVAGAKNYRGHWSFVIGVVSIILAAGALGSEIDDAIAHSSENQSNGLILAFLLAVSGVLSLISAQKLHRCSVELEYYTENYDV